MLGKNVFVWTACLASLQSAAHCIPALILINSNKRVLY